MKEPLDGTCLQNYERGLPTFIDEPVDASMPKQIPANFSYFNIVLKEIVSGDGYC